MESVTGLLFDLDGVICDTARYHFLAWKQLADRLDIPFTLEDNDRLKGVSRTDSLDIILSLGSRTMTQEEKERACKEKNDIYLDYINRLTADDLLPGVRGFLENARQSGYLVGLGSTSKNARFILDRLGITGLFDVIVDGNDITNAKPDPEVFLKGAQAAGLSPFRCLVFEDAVAGIQAAHAAGMPAVGIGLPSHLPEAEFTIPSLSGLTVEDVIRQLPQNRR